MNGGIWNAAKWAACVSAFGGVGMMVQHTVVAPMWAEQEERDALQRKRRAEKQARNLTVWDLEQLLSDTDKARLKSIRDQRSRSRWD